MSKIDFKKIEETAQKKINAAGSLADLDAVFKEYLGKRGGKLTQILRSLKDLEENERRKTGMLANKIKKNLIAAIDLRKKILESSTTKLHKKWIDISVPGKKPIVGHLHPLTLVRRKVEHIFQTMGFEIVDGPEIETEWYNFDALNIPKNHPARETLSLGKTFYLKGGGLMRTQTSSIQIHYMKKNNPPIRIIAPGKVFRAEGTDASHETNFYQIESLMVDKDISVANFKAIIQEFFRRFFEKPVKVRLRPSYFPFTEPSFEPDMSCLICGGKGCSVCQGTGWIEMGGAGMVHPKVLENGGLNPKNWQGFAFGMSLDRLTMMKYKIDDIRLFHSGDLRFLEQF